MGKVLQADPDLHHCLRLSVKAAKEAALSIISNVDKNVVVDSMRDVKIHADMKLNKIIVDRLKKESPYPVLSEEGGFSGYESDDERYRWIVDPLDGSLNFSRSIPLFCISIALWREMEPLVGVVYDFTRDELFTGLVGNRAWLNGKPIKVGGVTKKKNAILCTGFPVETDFSKEALLNFVEDIQSYKKVRLLGSAALSLAYVASERVDIYEENDIAVWDVAAGIAIVLAAGGSVYFQPAKIENRLIVRAANEFILSSDF